ncbi:hypothetical protein SI65_09199 [Aspergillus cristatus]|uniref:Transcription factor domain-containing protein n=1 Tax=Aspergillus cristatus TaxID=573508 RepID=A0A1E3B2Y2_ASPCR|nr:hypothetical protein SI65_09199 [Aspergillus cristatus]
MRRRVWWYLVNLDLRVSELAGARKSIVSQAWDTQLPLNVNDDDIDPAMTVPPKSRTGITDMSFCLFKYETVRALRSADLTSMSNSLSKNKSQMTLLSASQITQLKGLFEANFLRFCDPVIPLHLLLNVMIRSTLYTLYKLETTAQVFNHANAKASSGRQVSCIEALSHHNGQFPWGALVGLLWSMATIQWGQDEEKAWKHVLELFERYPELGGENQGLLRFVGTLALKAWDARSAPR